jgi:hypothetical protein
MESTVKNDATRLFGGEMMDIQFLSKFKPESCRPRTSHAFDQCWEAKNDWGCMPWIDFECSVMESTVTNYATRFFGGEMIENPFWSKPKPESCPPGALVMPLIRRWRPKMNGVHALDRL